LPLKLPWHSVFTAKTHISRLRWINIRTGTKFYIKSLLSLLTQAFLQDTNMAKSMYPRSVSVLHPRSAICIINSSA
jgi:hypothetical protein